MQNVRSKFLLGALCLLLVVQVLLGLTSRLVSGVLLIATTALWCFVVREARSGRLKVGEVAAASIVMILAMVLLPPATSLDVNSYTLYGRMMSEYGVSPYQAVPLAYAFDPWFSRISLHWSDVPSLYGPLFTGLSAGITALAGNAELAVRLGFQLLAGAALMASLVMLWKVRRDASAVAFLGLSPLMLALGVNDAHADVLLGAFLLAAVVALYAGPGLRWALLAGVCCGLAGLVKITALAALVGLVLWLVWRRDVRVWAAGLSGAMVSAVGWLLVGGLDALEPLLEASGRVSRYSLWNAGSVFAGDEMLSRIASASVIGAAAWLWWSVKSLRLPIGVMVAGLLAYQVLGAYTLAWYALWTLPLLALGGVELQRLRNLAWVHGTWVGVAYFSGYLAIAVAPVALWLVLSKKGRVWTSPNLSES